MALHDFVKTQFAYAKPYSIHIKDDYRRILYLDSDNGTVFKAAQARLYGFDKRSFDSINIYNWLADELFTYINNPVVETMGSFDDWHHRICDHFVAKCHAAGLIGSTAGAICYGLAQKFVNIALKYLYCFEDANSVDVYDKFTFCHMALDSYTYCPRTTSRATRIYRDYYGLAARISGAAVYKPFYAECVNPTINIKHLKAWSKLEYATLGSIPGYSDIQNEIRAYFNGHSITYANVMHLDIHSLAACAPTAILTPFETEFFIW